MQPLASPTRESWITEVTSNLEALLVDHAHCEKKAASTALALIYRYPEKLEMMAPLSMLAREELVHFERVLKLIEKRGFQFQRMLPSPYAGKLVKHIRKEEPNKLLDTLICCGLIEARSHERMQLLTTAFQESGDEELAQFYASLLASEARPQDDYLMLAEQFFGTEEFKTRLRELADCESAILASPGPEPRMHS